MRFTCVSFYAIPIFFLIFQLSFPAFLVNFFSTFLLIFFFVYLFPLFLLSLPAFLIFFRFSCYVVALYTAVLASVLDPDSLDPDPDPVLLLNSVPDPVPDS